MQKRLIFLVFGILVVLIVAIAIFNSDKGASDITQEDYYTPGVIGIGFKIGISQQEAEAVLEKYNLTFRKTDNLNLGMSFFEETGEKFTVNIGEGNEDYWISVLQKEEKVYDARRLPDPRMVLVD